MRRPCPGHSSFSLIQILIFRHSITGSCCFYFLHNDKGIQQVHPSDRKIVHFMNKLIETYKSVQRKQYFKRLGNYKLSYAFVGAGTHSIANLYPCIRHLGIPLRYICTQHADNAQKMAAQFPNCTGVLHLC